MYKKRVGYYLNFSMFASSTFSEHYNDVCCNTFLKHWKIFAYECHPFTSYGKYVTSNVIVKTMEKLWYLKTF